MIRAAEALLLPSAKLTDEERATADALEKSIEEHVRKFMEYRGCDYAGKETRPNVLSEINQRLKAAGFMTEWKFTAERNRFNTAAAPTVTGFQLNLSPSDEAYREATK